MPGYKAHTLAGLAVIGLVLAGVASWGVYELTWPAGLILAGVALLGALFPDVDTDSVGQNLFYALILALDIYLLVLQDYRHAALLGLVAILPIVGRHRGWTHTWWAMLVAPLPIVALPYYLFGTSPKVSAPFYLSAVAGYFSHLLLDRKFR